MKVKGKIAKKTAPRRPYPTRKPPTRLARLLALAYHVDRLVERGELPSHAAAARAIGVSKARISQVMNLLSLSPRIQEQILLGQLCMSERQIRRVLRSPDWENQETVLGDNERRIPATR
jgi:hypothetical protein